MMQRVSRPRPGKVGQASAPAAGSQCPSGLRGTQPHLNTTSMQHSPNTFIYTHIYDIYIFLCNHSGPPASGCQASGHPTARWALPNPQHVPDLADAGLPKDVNRCSTALFGYATLVLCFHHPVCHQIIPQQG